MKHTITYTCPHCGVNNKVTAWPYVPAQISGPPERCYPEEPAEIDPHNCDNCDAAFDEEEIFSIIQAYREDAMEARADARDERFYGKE